MSEADRKALEALMRLWKLQDKLSAWRSSQITRAQATQ